MDLKERIKQLMTEVICHLCTKEVPHKYQIQIEGTICISSDTEPPFAIQIAQLLSKAEAEARPRHYDRESSFGDGAGTSPGEPPPQTKNRHSSSPAQPQYEHSRHQRRTHSENRTEDADQDRTDKEVDMPVVESVSPQEIIHSTKRDSLERAPLPQKKRRRYSITQQQLSQELPESSSVDDREVETIVILPQKKRESARKLPSDEGIEVDRVDEVGAGDADDDRQFTVKDMVRNLIQSRDRGGNQILNDISKSLLAGQVKLVIPSVGSPPDTPLPQTPSAYDDHVFDLDAPEPPLTPLTPHTPLPSNPLTTPVNPEDDLTILQPLNLDPISPLPQDTGRKSSLESASFSYRSTPIPEPKSPDMKNESLDSNYDNKSLLTNLGHMSKETINGLIIVDQESQKAISPQDYVYKDENTGETLIKACDYCGKHFKYLSKLMEHIRSHTKTKPYKCSICGRTYTYKGDLTVHIRQHSLAKPYVCECGRAFASKKYLSVHQSQARIKGRHAVSKDDRMGPMFECTQCGKRFKFFSSFDLHLQTHNLQMPSTSGETKEMYECQACRCSFQDHVMFVEHVLEHEHGKIGKVKEKQRCQSLSSLPRDVDRKRRLSERTSPKQDFYRPSTSDISLPPPIIQSPRPMLSSPQFPILNQQPQTFNVVMASPTYTPPYNNQMIPVQLSAPMRLSIPNTVRMSLPMRMIGPSGGTVVENSAGQGGGKMFVDETQAPFTPRLHAGSSAQTSAAQVFVDGRLPDAVPTATM